jgi:flavoprotein
MLGIVSAYRCLESWFYNVNNDNKNATSKITISLFQWLVCTPATGDTTAMVDGLATLLVSPFLSSP